MKLILVLTIAIFILSLSPIAVFLKFGTALVDDEALIVFSSSEALTNLIIFLILAIAIAVLLIYIAWRYLELQRDADTLQQDIDALRHNNTGELLSFGVLTRRETQVLSLIATGMTDNEIAERLTIQPSTVGNHIGNIFRKIGVANRVEATTYAFRNGVVEPPDAE